MAVQISGNDITVPRDTTVTRNLTVGGVLTYEDVTNVDSVGLITARSGIEIGASPGVAASISVDGNAIFSGITTIGGALSGTTGTFSGALSGTTGTFTDNLDVATNIRHIGDTDTKISFDTNTIHLDTDNSERLRINSSGKILVGDNTAENTMGLNANVQTFGTDASASGVAIRRGSNDAQAAFLIMSKSRNTSVGSRTILQNGDEVGNIFFVADDGTDLASNTAAIKSQIDAAPGGNDTPGNLSFWTTADGSNSATQRMIIHSMGAITTPTNPAFFAYRGSNSSNYPSQTVIFSSQLFDRGGDNYNPSNGRFTAPVAGYYQFGVYMYLGFSGGAVRVVHCHFRKNNSDHAQLELAGGTNADGGNYYHPSGHGGCLIPLAKDDYVTFYINAPSTIGVSDYIMYNTSYFYGYLVG